MGTFYVNDFNKYGRTWQVLMSAEQGFRMRPDDIQSVYVRARNGDMVPLSSLVTVRYTSGPDSVERFNNLPAVKIIGQAAPGISSGQAIQRVEQIAAKCCRRTSASTGAGRATRRSAREAHRRSRWCSP